VHQEDHAIVEGLQVGRSSSVMDDGGLLSPHWETSVRRFHELLTDALV
jgi:choline monooxygenase